MVKLTKIYTRKGDGGETGLTGGKKVKKHHPRVAAFGTVDEANAVIGLARLHTPGQADEALARIQNDLFDLGADLSTPGDVTGEVLRVTEDQVQWLEEQIDFLNADLESLTSFVLPGGSEASAALHLARTVVRRAERLAFQLGESEDVNPEALRYLNRLSDYLFVLARAMNENGKGDVLWVPGKSRKGR